MDMLLEPHKLSGAIPAISSKSAAHRLLICAALSGQETELICPDTSRDIAATAACLRAMGAAIRQADRGYRITPGPHPEHATLSCGESGATLRFLLPVAAALGMGARFQMEGRLPQRPLFPLDRELESHGILLSRPAPDILETAGQLTPGAYHLPGNVSSQYITGLLFALPLLPAPSTLTVTGPLESAPYVEMTLQALGQFGISVCRQGNCFSITPSRYDSPGSVEAEGDWSNAAFWLAANAMGSRILVKNLTPDSLQGDRAVTRLLRKLGNGAVLNGTNVPDLVPILAIAATAAPGQTRFAGAARLRLKESDRIQSVCGMIRSLGGIALETNDGFIVQGTALTGGTVDARGDHRIAMAAAVAATVTSGPVTLLGAQAVSKSYPRFWDDYRMLGGHAKEVTP